MILLTCSEREPHHYCIRCNCTLALRSGCLAEVGHGATFVALAGASLLLSENKYALTCSLPT